MKKHLLRAMTFAAVAAISASALAGCGGNGDAGSSTPSSKPASSAPASSAAEEKETIHVGQLPLVDEKATISIGTLINDGAPGNDSIRFWKELEEKTNVHVEWSDTMKSAWAEKKNVLVAADNQPDMYLSMGIFTADDVLNLGTSGKFQTIEQYIDDYMPNLAAYFAEHPEWKSMDTAPDGHIYNVPNIMEVGGGHFYISNIPFINQGWMEKVNLSFEWNSDPAVPLTAEQFKEILTAFKTQDPNGNGKADEIPLSLSSADILYDFGASFGILGKGVMVKGDKVVWSIMQPEFKEFVTWLNDLWKDGLLDVETFTQNGSMYNSKLTNPDDILGFTTSWRVGSTQTGPDDNRFTLSTPIKIEGHDAAWPKGQSFSIERGNCVLTSSAKNPELCLAWADNLLTPENSLQINSAQLIGEHLEKKADGTYHQLRPIDWNREGEDLLMPGSKLFIVTKEEWHKQDVLPPVSIQKDPVEDLYLANYSPKGFSRIPDVWMTIDDAKTVNNILSEVTPYIDSLFASWVTEGTLEKTWDEAQSTLVNMGANEALEIYQKYYDATK